MPASSPTKHAAVALALALAAAPVASAGGPAAVGRDDALRLGTPKSFQAAVQAIEQATGVKSAELTIGRAQVQSGRAFALDPRTADRLLAGSHSSFRKAGVYLFRYERSYGIPGDKDRLGLVATPDRDAVIRQVGTSSPDGRVTPEALNGWLKALAADEPFELVEIGVDYVAGTFARTPKDPMAIAKRCVGIAPELVGSRAGSIDLLAKEIRDNRTLYLIW